MLIECDTCAVRGPACQDCVVSVLLALPACAGEGADLDDADGRNESVDEFVVAPPGHQDAGLRGAGLAVVHHGGR